MEDKKEKEDIGVIEEGERDTGRQVLIAEVSEEGEWKRWEVKSKKQETKGGRQKVIWNKERKILTEEENEQGMG